MNKLKAKIYWKINNFSMDLFLWSLKKHQETNTDRASDLVHGKEKNNNE